MTSSRAELLERVAAIASDAGRVVMEVYATDFDVVAKGDASPVTVADERAEALIVAALHELAPAIPIVAEEAVAAGHVPAVGSRFWLVDPLDGTKEFIKRNGEFTVNIALIEDGRPVLGVVYAPALGRLYAGATGVGAYVVDSGGRRPLRCRAVPSEGLTVVASASHGDPALLDDLPVRSPGGGAAGDRLVAEAVPRRRGRGRPLSALRPDDGVGHRRRPRRAGRAPAARSPIWPARRSATASRASRTRPSWREDRRLKPDQQPSPLANDS